MAKAKRHKTTPASKRNKLNPSSSPTIQAFLDVIKCAKEQSSQEDLQLFSKALKTLQEDAVLRSKADQIFNSHRYPDEYITYTKTALFDQCPERFRLPEKAQLMLGLLERIASQEGLVRISQVNLSEFLGWDRKTIRKALEDLQKYGFLAVYIQPPKGSREPVTYMIDQRITRNGKEPSHEEKKLFDENAVEDYEIARTNLWAEANKHQRSVMTMRKGDKLLHIGTLIPFTPDDKKKEPSQ